MTSKEELTSLAQNVLLPKVLASTSNILGVKSLMEGALGLGKVRLGLSTGSLMSLELSWMMSMSDFLLRTSSALCGEF